MEYNFKRKKPVLGQIILAMHLDRKKMRERIVIGEKSEIRDYLTGDDGQVYCDFTYPLGQLLIDFESDPDGQWETSAARLHKSYKRVLDWNRHLFIKPSAEFLKEKYESGHPAAIYAAIRTWNDYLYYFNQNKGPTRFMNNAPLLYGSFRSYADNPPYKDGSDALLQQALPGENLSVGIWYPFQKRKPQWVVAYDSFQPLLFYYLTQLEDWGLCFLTCKICGNVFLARSKRYELCSDQCRTIQARENKRQFDERTSDVFYEKQYESTYNYWYNRLRKLRKKAAAPEQLAAVEQAFSVFRKEGVQKKKEVKARRLELREFNDWLEGQRRIVDGLMEG